MPNLQLLSKKHSPSNLANTLFSTFIPLSAIVASPTNGYPKRNIICFERLLMSALQNGLLNNATLFIPFRSVQN